MKKTVLMLVASSSGLVGLIVGLLVGTGPEYWAGSSNLVAHAQAQQPGAGRTATPNMSPEEQINVFVYEKANRSVVNISTRIRTEDFFLWRELEEEGAGSGCVWDKEGHVITNWHVIEEAVASRGHIRVTLYDGSSYPAVVVGYDPPNDLSVLEIDAPPEKLWPMELGDSSHLRVGLRVFVIGNPFGLDRTMTTGIISSLNRTLPVSKTRTIKGVIQTDAAINPGNSGGPLLDKHGRLIGLNTAIVSPVGQSSGVGFAIPVDNIKRVVPQLIQFGYVTRADIGILAVYETEQGLLLAKLDPRGAAAEAGLRGPRVVRWRGPFGQYVEIDPSMADRIVAVDGKPVRTFGELIEYVESRKPGDTVTVQFYRDGQLSQVVVKLKASR